MTPYYSEDVIYSKKDCLSSPAASSTEGVSTMLYLQVSREKDGWVQSRQRTSCLQPHLRSECEGSSAQGHDARQYV
jgi:hypothetical protein